MLMDKGASPVDALRVGYIGEGVFDARERGSNTSQYLNIEDSSNFCPSLFYCLIGQKSLHSSHKGLCRLFTVL